MKNLYKSVISKSIVGLFLFALVFTPICVGAVGTPGMPDSGKVGSTGTSLEDVIQDIIKWIIGLIILISIFFFAYGGIMYMTAGGDETKVETAKKLLTGAILGLIIALLSWAIVNVIVKTIFGYGGTTT